MPKKNITPLSNTEIASFCSQMAMILKSGISSIEGISIMLQDAKGSDETELLAVMNDTLTQTGILHEALKETGAFPGYLLNMVRIGEQTGRLDDVMQSLAEYYEKEASLAQTIKNAVTYPLIMIFMMILVIIVLITKVMPVFNQVFKQLGSEMTGPSRAILHIGAFLDRHSVIFIGLLIVIAALAVYAFKTTRGQNTFRSIIVRFRSTRNISEKISSYRFANGMALTLSSGLTPEECLNLAADLIEQDEFRRRLSKCKEAVSSGEDLCNTLLENGVFSGVYARMASIGSRTGILDDVMNKIAHQYEEDIDTHLSSIIATVEPTLVIILSIIVGIILLSVMLPLMNIMAAL